MDFIDLDEVRTAFHNFCIFLWNSKTKEFLGRGGRSWVEIGIFYFIFYGVLSGFFIATIIGFHKTIDDFQPALLGDGNLLKGNPGLGFRPMPDIGTTLIRIRQDRNEIQSYVQHINKLLEKYRNETSLTTVDCSDITEPRPDGKVPCRYNLSALTEHCHENNSYGMADGQPCVLLKLNKIYGWTPSQWKKDDVKTDPNIPNHIKDVYTAGQVWIDCRGENPADRDNLGHVSQIQYYPQQGFPVAFYPYTNQVDYRAPLVFVKFLNVTRHVGIMVECVALDRNIQIQFERKLDILIHLY
ncbi:Sodium/potassium-transporting ATPase subunit beta-1 [Bulinus truncatus]|nr:Sodium/potassium-transporting ATPase subunit beta-1 [Bulinus truncatus]